MPELAERALDTAAQKGATYADVRLVRRNGQQVNVKSGHVQGVSLNETEGLGVRVLVDGAWGFASTSDLRGPEVERVAALATRIARASARVSRHPVRLDEQPAVQGEYETPLVEDPFEVPIDETVELLLAADAAMGAVEGVATTQADYHAFREWKTFASSSGSSTRQVITHVDRKSVV